MANLTPDQLDKLHTLSKAINEILYYEAIGCTEGMTRYHVSKVEMSISEVWEELHKEEDTK